MYTTPCQVFCLEAGAGEGRTKGSRPWLGWGYSCGDRGAALAGGSAALRPRLRCAGCGRIDGRRAALRPAAYAAGLGWLEVCVG